MFKTIALGSPLLACGSQRSRWDGGDQPDAAMYRILPRNE